MNREVIITCALTGAGDTVGRNPHVPVTPAQIAEDALAAAAAGEVFAGKVSVAAPGDIYEI